MFQVLRLSCGLPAVLLYALRGGDQLPAVGCNPGPERLPNIEWHINRAMHMAGRCTGCGACGEACPLGIPIHLLTQKLLEDVDAEFGAKSGTLGQKGNALSTFDPSDKENFIR